MAHDLDAWVSLTPLRISPPPIPALTPTVHPPFSPPVPSLPGEHLFLNWGLLMEYLRPSLNIMGACCPGAPSMTSSPSAALLRLEWALDVIPVALLFGT